MEGEAIYDNSVLIDLSLPPLQRSVATDVAYDCGNGRTTMTTVVFRFITVTPQVYSIHLFIEIVVSET